MENKQPLEQPTIKRKRIDWAQLKYDLEENAWVYAAVIAFLLVVLSIILQWDKPITL